MNERQKNFENKWLNKTVRLRLTSDYQMPNTAYHVTAALFEWEDNDETVFAIMSSEYSLPDKPWWYVMRFGKDNDIDEHLDKHFEII